MEHNYKYYSQHWPKTHAPKRARERIAAGKFTGKEWLLTDKQLAKELASRNGTLVALVGGRGPGKTQLAVCAMHRACLAGRSSRYIKALDYFAEVKAAYSDYVKEEERDVIKRFCLPTLLVVDGMEERGETSWEDRMLSHLIDRRYDDMKDTILVANLRQDKFEESIGTSAASRLRETGGIIVCDWGSFRE